MKNTNKKKSILIVASVVVILLATVGGTLAYLVTQTEMLINIFNPTRVTCAVVESWTDGNSTKSNVTVKNTGTTDAYIRVAIVGNWVKDGSIVAPWTIEQGTFTGLPGENWVKSGNYYYYTKSVAPGATISDYLFTQYTAPTAPIEGAHLEMTIIAQAVQASPADAVAAAWNVSIALGSVTPITNQ